MNQSEFKEVINASKEEVWEVLFSQYGDIHIHNPSMEPSNFVQSMFLGESVQNSAKGHNILGLGRTRSLLVKTLACAAMQAIPTLNVGTWVDM